LLNIEPEEPPPIVAPAAAPADSWSTTTLETLPEDALASVLAQLGSSVEQLVVACVSSSLCDAVSRSWARDVLLLSSDPHLATDQLLLQLTLGRLARGLVRELDIAGCELLTKSAVTRAAMAQRTIQHLNGTNVGVGSWTPEQLLRVIAALDDLRVLTADCRSLGASSPLLRLLAHPAVRLRKLVLHKPESGAVLEPAADDLVSLTAALKRKPPGGGDAPVASLREVDLGQSGGGLRGAFEFVAALLAGEECQVQKLALSGVRSASVEALAALGAALDGNRHLEQLSLGCNFISAEGCRALAAAVASHPALRSLSLEHNPIQDSGAAALSAALCGRGSRLTPLHRSEGRRLPRARRRARGRRAPHLPRPRRQPGHGGGSRRPRGRPRRPIRLRAPFAQPGGKLPPWAGGCPLPRRGAAVERLGRAPPGGLRGRRGAGRQDRRGGGALVAPPARPVAQPDRRPGRVGSRLGHRRAARAADDAHPQVGRHRGRRRRGAARRAGA